MDKTTFFLQKTKSQKIERFYLNFIVEQLAYL